MKELEGNQHQPALDQTLLAALHTKCANSDEQFEARMMARLSEFGAVDGHSKALHANKAAALKDFISGTNQATSSRKILACRVTRLSADRSSGILEQMQAAEMRAVEEVQAPN